MAGRPPSYSDSTDGGSDSKKDNILEKLSAMGNQAPKLVSVVNHSVEGVADSLEKLRRNTAESVKHRSPTVCMQLMQLQTFLEDVVRKCQSYCDACKDVGDYGSDEELIKEIMEDLESGKFNEINDFLDEIKDLLSICETRFERYKTSGESATTAMKEAGQEFEKERGKSVGSQKKERIVGSVVGGLGAGATAGGVLLTFFNPPAGIALIIAGVAAGSAAVGLTIDAGYTQAEIDIFNQACLCVIDLNSNLASAMRTAEDMREKIYKIKTAGPGIDRLESKSKAAQEGKLATKKLKAPLRRVKAKMGQLRDESTKLLERLENL